MVLAGMQVRSRLADFADNEMALMFAWSGSVVCMRCPLSIGFQVLTPPLTELDHAC